MKIAGFALAGAAFVALAVGSPADATVLSFESPSVAAAGYTYSSTAAYPSAPSYFGAATENGVTYAGMAGIQSNGSAWGFTNAPDGTQTAFLQSYSGVYPQGGSVSFSSSLITSLISGQQYDLSFYVEGRSYMGGSPYSVDIAGATSSFGAPGTSAWTLENLLFTASADPLTITFSVAPQSSTDISIGLDKVNISAVPEPATWAMLLIGLAGVGFMAYRRKQTGPQFRFS